jgi:mannose-6-phosphate isomerase-like protein (cupin superfamily)
MHSVAWIVVALAQAISMQPPVTFLTGAELLHAIETAPEETPGQPGLYSLRLSATSEYPVIGIRRTQPGRSELHTNFADVWYVLWGDSTFVTGGAVVDGVETQPGEIRGRAISGGDSRHLKNGDFAVVPAGVPHWISEIKGKEFLYIVVKVPTTTQQRR